MTRLSDLFRARIGREQRLRAVLAAGLATLLLAAAGCGGGSSPSTSSTATQASAPPVTTTAPTTTATTKTGTTKTTSTTKTGTTTTSTTPSHAKAKPHARPHPPKPARKRAVVLDRETSAYLRSAVGRDSFEVFASSIAGQRTTNVAVRRLATDISRQRGLEIVDLRQSAAAQHVALPRNPLTTANSRLIQRLIPLRGKALDQAYLAMERSNITAAIAQASSAQQSAPTKLRTRLAGYLKAYRRQLATLDSLRGSGA